MKKVGLRLFSLRLFYYIYTVINNNTMTKQEKYPNGYQDKINYYQGQAMQAMATGDDEYVGYFMRKMEYFMKRQAAWLYNPKMLQQLAK